MADAPFFIFDLDGTLVDNVYQHVLAWKRALDEEGLDVPTWQVHRKIGMSGSLLVEQLGEETGAPISSERVEKVQHRHGEIFREIEPKGRPLPGASELLGNLSRRGIAWVIATSGHAQNARAALDSLGVAEAVVITRDQVEHAKPEPDLFLKAAHRLKRNIDEAFIVGDSVWDMIAAQRAGGRGIGLLSGGYASAELDAAGAYRVFDDPANLRLHLDELLTPL